MSSIERAIELAAKAHAGQKDKAGQPYIFHPLRLMFTLETLDEKITAVLHDVVEDTPVTLRDLAAEGFSKEIIDAVEALTKREAESRLEAATRAAQNKIARMVKLADVGDNMNLTRLATITEKDRERLKEYEQVKALLLSTE